MTTSSLSADHLRMFVATVETGSLTGAARRIGVTQSAISQQLKQLESFTGRPLLTRTASGVHPTREGREFLVYAQDVVRALADAELFVREPPLRGQVRLGVAEDIASARLPHLLGRFRRIHPAVRMEIETGLSGELSDRLARGEFDLVLGKRAEPRQGGRVVLREPLVWAAAPGFANLARIRPLPLALHPRPSVTADAMLTALRGAGHACVVVLTSPSISGLRAGMLAGLGVGAFGRAFMPDGLLELDAAAAGLPALPALEFGLERRDGTLSEAAAALADLLEQELARGTFPDPAALPRDNHRE